MSKDLFFLCCETILTRCIVYYINHTRYSSRWNWLYYLMAVIIRKCKNQIQPACLTSIAITGIKGPARLRSFREIQDDNRRRGVSHHRDHNSIKFNPLIDGDGYVVHTFVPSSLHIKLEMGKVIYDIKPSAIIKIPLCD